MAKWFQEEVDLVKLNYRLHGTRIPELRTKHSDKSIQKIAKKLGIRCITRPGRPHDWTPEEIDIVRQKYPTMGRNIPELRIKYSSKAIEGVAYRIGVRCREFWTPEEDNIIADNFPRIGKSVTYLLTGRSHAALVARASQLGIRQDIEPAWTPSPSVKETDIAYVAGFIDGEGTISLTGHLPSKNYLRAVISFVNTNEQVVRYVCKILDAHFRRIARSSQARAHHKDIFNGAIHTRNHVMGVLKVITPYLVVKKMQAELVMEFLEGKKDLIAKKEYRLSERDKCIYSEIRRLNKRGREVT